MGLSVITYRSYVSTTWHQKSMEVDSGGQLSPSVWPPQSDIRDLIFLDNSGLYWTIFAWNRVTAVPVEGNGDLQTLICVLVARPGRCPTLSNAVLWQSWMAAYPGYTLQMKMLFLGWPFMTRIRDRKKESKKERKKERKNQNWNLLVVMWQDWIW